MKMSESPHPKERATLLGIQRGMALMRRDSSIIGIKPDGSETIVSESYLEDDAWADAVKALELHVENTTKTYDELLIYSDGGSRGNPGASASGYVIMTTNKEVVEDGGEYLGITTNNQAEYQAVKLGLEQVAKFKVKRISFFIDSLMVVNQMNGKWRVKNKDLWPVHQEIKRLIEPYEHVSFTHVYRENNTLADAQVNYVLNARDHAKKSRPKK